MTLIEGHAGNLSQVFGLHRISYSPFIVLPSFLDESIRQCISQEAIRRCPSQQTLLSACNLWFPRFVLCRKLTGCQAYGPCSSAVKAVAAPFQHRTRWARLNGSGPAVASKLSVEEVAWQPWTRPFLRHCSVK